MNDKRDRIENHLAARRALLAEYGVESLTEQDLDQLNAASLRLHEVGLAVAGTFATRGLAVDAAAIRSAIERITESMDRRLAAFARGQDRAGA